MPSITRSVGRLRPQCSHPLRRLGRRLCSTRRRRLLRQLDQRAVWAAQARNASTVACWTEARQR